MQVVTTVGLDLAKSVFQVHGVDAAGQVVIRRQLKRRYVQAFFEKLPPCLVGISLARISLLGRFTFSPWGFIVFIDRFSPPAAIVIAVFRDNNCSILRVCSCSWQRNCDRTQSSQGDKKCAQVFLRRLPTVSEGRCDVPFFLRLSRSGSVTSAPPCPTTTASGLPH
jgi:hypothetical protein